MKKLLFVFVAVFSLTACQFATQEQISEQAESLPSFILSPSKSNSFSVTSAESVFVIDATTSSITLTGDLAGKTVYYATVNTTSKNIPSEYVRFISAENTRSVASSSRKLERNHSEPEENEFHCHHEHDFIPEFEPSSERSAIASNSSSIKKLSYEAGVTSKEFFVNTESNVYQKKSGTLYALNDVCNIWIIDDDEFLTSFEKRTEIASIYAEKFALVYPLIQNIFGKESDFIYSSTSGAKQNMNEACETGSKVNILIYDLFSDGSDGNTIGFFLNTDYYKNGLKFRNCTIDHSNEGKYFYIDSHFAQAYFDYTLSTLAHEFQHMINFSVKSMNGKSSDMNFNEMLSMLCEEFMQEYLGFGDEYSPKNRVHKFLSKYYEAGLREYNDTLQSYANAYAFGSWLARSFGGKILVKEMMANGKANNECIASAVNSVNGTAYTFNDLSKLFVKACFDRDYYSPVIFENDIVTDIAPSYGIFLKSYGMIENDETSLTLNFNSNSGNTDSGVLTYIYIK